MMRNPKLLPCVDLDFIERVIEKGHAAPKQSNMIASKILNFDTLLLMSAALVHDRPFV